jgi:hypothetical protein
MELLVVSLSINFVMYDVANQLEGLGNKNTS